MGFLEGMRMVLSARSFLQLGPAMSCKWVPTSGSTQVLEANHDLLFNFRHLALSPAEAYLSSQVKTLGTPLINTTDYRLPAVLKSATITVPTFCNTAVIEKDLPSLFSIIEKIEPIGPQQPVEIPSPQVHEKRAARLIVIRRKKMKKHKLRKLRKKMRFVLLKRRQKREYRKEKLFQATQMAKVRKYEAFNAVNYITDVLQQTKAKPIPKIWKGKRLPEFIIKELMEKEKCKKIKNKQELLESEELKKIKNNYYNKV